MYKVSGSEQEEVGSQHGSHGFAAIWTYGSEIVTVCYICSTKLTYID